MSLTASDAGSTASKPDSLLFNLPGELRNEIYRRLLRGIYTISAPPKSILYFRHIPLLDDMWGIKERPGELMPYSDLSILSVSKTVRDEALPALYSESIFRIYVLFDLDETLRLSSLEAVEHMMNIELDVIVGWPVLHAAEVFRAGSDVECMNKYKQVWKATLGCISRTQIIRSTLKISWRVHTSDIRRTFQALPGVDAAMPEWMYRTLKKLIRFRTLMFKVFVPRNETFTDNTGERFVVFGSKMKAIKEDLVHTLGPCDIDNEYDHDDYGYVGTLTFHPQQHIPAILKRRAEALRTEAAGFEQKAERVELGL